MKRIMCCLLSCVLFLSACGGQEPEEPALKEDQVCAAYKIMEVSEYEGKYSVLAYDCKAERPELTFVSLNDADIEDVNGTALTAADLKGGMVIEVTWDGMVQESWPAGIHVDRVRVAEQQDDLVGLYLAVLNELWETDSGLNHEAEILGLDFSTLTNLPEIEKDALAYLFSCDVGLGLQYVFGTWEELCDRGYIDRENLYWEDGVFFALTIEGEPGEKSFTFDAQKWRSGLGAIFFTDCTAKKGRDGQWSYQPGGFAIS